MMKRITLKISVMLLIVLSGCYPFEFMTCENKEPVVQPVVDIPRPTPVVKNAIKIEDLVSKYHEKSEQIEETNKKIIDLEKKIEDTKKDVILESDNIVDRVKSITETLPEPQKDAVSFQMDEILRSSSKIKGSLETLPEEVPQSIPEIGPQPIPVDIEETQQKSGWSINVWGVIGAVFFGFGIFLLWKNIFSPKNQFIVGSNTSG